MVALSAFVVGVIGNIISVMVFLSPIKTFWRIVKRRSTEDFESLPYICTLLNSSLWIYYGISKSGAYLVATVNCVGAVLEIAYISLFLMYAPPRMKTKTAILVGILNVGFLTAVILVTLLALRGDIRIDAIGFMCAALNIAMYGSPLAAMKTVVATKSVEYMPFLLSFFLFLNGGIWTTYALLTSDWFIIVPNGTGFILGIAQLVLYAIYWKPKPSTKISDGLEEGSQHERLISSSNQCMHEKVEG